MRRKKYLKVAELYCSRHDEYFYKYCYMCHYEAIDNAVKRGMKMSGEVKTEVKTIDCCKGTPEVTKSVRIKLKTPWAAYTIEQAEVSASWEWTGGEVINIFNTGTYSNGNSSVSIPLSVLQEIMDTFKDEA